MLYPNQWNHVRVELGCIAAGKTISAIQLYYDNDGATAATVFQDWIDNVAIEANPKRIDGSSLTHYVDTRRGSNPSHSPTNSRSSSE